MKKKVSVILILFMHVMCISFANVKPNSLFTKGCVLQQGKPVPVWGTADEGEKVTVEFNGQLVSAVAKDGKWKVQLKPMAATLKGQSMVISGNNTLTIKDILIGEVWLCSGQSNMGFPLKAVKGLGNYPQAKEVLADAQNYPLIRQFTIPLIKSTNIPDKIIDVNGQWLVSDSNKAKNFSAVAYFFARELYNKLKVPIGIINSSYGGTAIENWMSKQILDTMDVSKSIFDNFYKALNEFPEKYQSYKNDEKSVLEKYSKDSAEAVSLKLEMPRKPAPPMSPAERGGPTGLYNTMIYPLIPYAIKGVTWYQGEANASRGIQYRKLFPVLIDEWRTEWNDAKLPFFFIQLPGWKNHFPELKEAQLLTFKNVPNTSMTVIYDCDDTLDVHPGNKQPVGERLSLPARSLVYGEKNLEFMGPIYESMEISGDKIILSFSHSKNMYVSKGEINDFVISGQDKIFYKAHAELINNKIYVSAKEVKNPVAVRAGWRFCPQLNIYNESGLPLSPFRTDVQ